MTAPELWNHLAAARLVEGECPRPAEPSAPWPVRTMMGIAGWVGSLFLLGFAGSVLSALFKSADAAIPAGLLCCGCAFLLFSSMPRNDFAQQAGLAISLSGQALLVVGVDHLIGERNLTFVFLALAGVAALLCVLLPNYLHRILTAGAASVMFFLATASRDLPGLGIAVITVACCLVWLRDETRLSNVSFWEPAGFGLAIALLPIEGAAFLGADFWQFLNKNSHGPVLSWIGPLASGLAVMGVAWILLSRLHVEPGSRAGVLACTGAAIVALCGWMAPGVSASLLIATLGFAAGLRSLQWLGLAAFLAYLAHFYYQLQITLLQKSIVLSGTGVALLILWAVVRREERSA